MREIKRRARQKTQPARSEFSELYRGVVRCRFFGRIVASLHVGFDEGCAKTKAACAAAESRLRDVAPIPQTRKSVRWHRVP